MKAARAEAGHIFTRRKMQCCGDMSCVANLKSGDYRGASGSVRDLLSFKVKDGL